VTSVVPKLCLKVVLEVLILSVSVSAAAVGVAVVGLATAFLVPYD
jgi:hypothetical protein